MISSISDITNYTNDIYNSYDVGIDSNNIDKQLRNDTVSIKSTSIMDEEIKNAFNNVMSDLSSNQSELLSIHEGLSLDRVKALLSL